MLIVILCVCVCLFKRFALAQLNLTLYTFGYLFGISDKARPFGNPAQGHLWHPKTSPGFGRVLRSRPSDSSKSKQNWTHVILENLLAQMIWYILTLNSPIQSCLLSLLETRKSQHKPTKPNQTPSKPTHINDKKNKVLSFQYCLKGIISSQGSTNSNTIHILRLSIFIALLGTLVGSISSQR